ncbi:MAG: hypothetical protein LBQ24_01715 [Candidatus Peribacteria bacterium]|jgi:hypothetical protein|nr:hypothetical protein [Candidatus Peribacteria bacterium]
MKKSTNDLSKTNKSDIKLKKDNNIKISKNKTEKFDTFFQKDKEKDVDIVNPPKNLAFFISKIKIFFKKHFLKAQIENGKYFKGFLFIVLILFLLL